MVPNRIGLYTYVINVLGQTVGHGLCLHEETVVFVGRFGQAHLVRLLGHCLTVRHYWVGLLDRNASVVLFQILRYYKKNCIISKTNVCWYFNFFLYIRFQKVPKSSKKSANTFINYDVYTSK